MCIPSPQLTKSIQKGVEKLTLLWCCAAPARWRPAASSATPPDLWSPPGLSAASTWSCSPSHAPLLSAPGTETHTCYESKSSDSDTQISHIFLFSFYFCQIKIFGNNAFISTSSLSKKYFCVRNNTMQYQRRWSTKELPQTATRLL